ncbi:hypothetical protein [Acetivibrio clariflavus]|uniref:Uncharacterized protein n=1 Tax=Acetivibrio clariflavus (strain DSM 19732 / NBRC 101661 / EBR45) TaxID=720554 RepID=G8LSW3_ACECE|nr:hypothetical protein [Acetivibrio clariflavus]AEV70476.1 hypothetical protein Clocl_4040 [Acetivibrio clariflavus DSM 19732]
MVEVYYYVPQDKVRDSIECGLKLSQWYEKEVQIEFENKKCLCALLNPRDDMDKYKSPDYKCLRLELYPEYCYVADKSLYELGLQHDEVMKLYMDSIIPIKDYIFGMYRLPECLVTTTVIPEQISLLDKGLGSPILFNNSEELYINNLIEDFRQKYDDLNDRLLFGFFKGRATEGEMEMIEKDGNRFVAFIDKKTDRAFTVKKP